MANIMDGKGSVLDAPPPRAINVGSCMSYLACYPQTNSPPSCSGVDSHGNNKKEVCRYWLTVKNVCVELALPACFTIHVRHLQYYVVGETLSVPALKYERK